MPQRVSFGIFDVNSEMINHYCEFIRLIEDVEMILKAEEYRRRPSLEKRRVLSSLLCLFFEMIRKKTSPSNIVCKM